MAACSSSAASSILSLHSCEHQPSRSSSFLSRPSISFRPFPINLSRKTTSLSLNPSFSPSFSVNCLFYGFDAADSEGGDVEGFEREDFVSTQKVRRKREFSALGNVLKQMELLDMGAIGESVSGSAKEAMKRTISTMLGLLPSDQFDVTVTVSMEPLERILRSSIVTGYTLWNAEYRVSLIRNFSISHEVEESSSLGTESLETLPTASGSRSVLYSNHERMDKEEEEIPKFADLPAEALNYIKELESKLAVVEKELAVQKQECNELDGGETNDLLNYLRSLEPEMVMELSSPSSPEVDEIIQQLVDNSLQKVLEVQTQRKAGSRMRDDPYATEEALCTSRDYLAKLLFWCMLLGHHMRGLEYRLHMSCVVGIF